MKFLACSSFTRFDLGRLNRLLVTPLWPQCRQLWLHTPTTSLQIRLLLSAGRRRGRMDGSQQTSWLEHSMWVLGSSWMVFWCWVLVKTFWTYNLSSNFCWSPQDYRDCSSKCLPDQNLFYNTKINMRKNFLQSLSCKLFLIWTSTGESSLILWHSTELNNIYWYQTQSH